jgi:hypothetical protein
MDSSIRWVNSHDEEISVKKAKINYFFEPLAPKGDFFSMKSKKPK